MTALSTKFTAAVCGWNSYENRQYLAKKSVYDCPFGSRCSSVYVDRNVWSDCVLATCDGKRYKFLTISQQTDGQDSRSMLIAVW